MTSRRPATESDYATNDCRRDDGWKNQPFTSSISPALVVRSRKPHHFHSCLCCATTGRGVKGTQTRIVEPLKYCACIQLAVAKLSKILEVRN